MNRLSSRMACLSFLVAALAAGAPAAGQTAEPEKAPSEVRTAPVTIDGRALFHLRGTASFPAAERAARVRNRILELARDPSFDPTALVVVDLPIESRILARETPVVRLVDADGEQEGLDRQVLARVYVENIAQAMSAYRQARTRARLTDSAWRVALATVVALLLAVGARKLLALVRRRLDARLARRHQGVSVGSVEIVRSERVVRLWHIVLRVGGLLVFVALAFAYLEFTLPLLPWTRGTAAHLAQWVLAPLSLIGSGLVDELPNLVFLTVLFLLVRGALGVSRLFFAAVGRGELTLGNFDAAWAVPTSQIVRIAVLGIALVVAYPYIPGSETQAFKGLTVFFGVLFSLGSSSLLSNVAAGYSMIYRRAFRDGDVVEIGSTLGIVLGTRLQATHLRTLKNEEVIIPNSTVIATEIKNFSALCKGPGLILHTTVGIGYETPWRQVEAMLLEAASRTPGLLADPKPFVNQLELATFAVTYELNAYCADARVMRQTYTDLHRQILDVFNEHGVQIMTPAYEGDPEQAKVVPKDRWYQAPAQETSGATTPKPSR